MEKCHGIMDSHGFNPWKFCTTNCNSLICKTSFRTSACPPRSPADNYFQPQRPQRFAEKCCSLKSCGPDHRSLAKPRWNLWQLIFIYQSSDDASGVIPFRRLSWLASMCFMISDEGMCSTHTLLLFTNFSQLS